MPYWQHEIVYQGPVLNFIYADAAIACLHHLPAKYWSMRVQYVREPPMGANFFGLTPFSLISF